MLRGGGNLMEVIDKILILNFCATDTVKRKQIECNIFQLSVGYITGNYRKIQEYMIHILGFEGQSSVSAD